MSYAKEIIKSKPIIPDLPEKELEEWHKKLIRAEQLHLKNK